MNVTKEQVEAGQAAYTPRMLSIYNFLILRVIVPYIWKCPIDNVIKLYNANISSNHLEIGVGSGYFLDNCKFPSDNPRLALMDLNPNSLKFTAEKVSRYKPEIYRGNILEPIETDMEKFDSIAINAVIHCLPGTMSTKLVVFDHINALLNPGGVVFGSTILNIGVKQNWLTKKFMKNFNNRRIFCNLEDDLSTLEEGLTERFSKSEVKVIGTVALFRAEV
ncbi:MAG: class I SAM-dependent methyltransferase [Candidatus Dadabacteria bacterium]|nr:MAG: class I SAM-dependent methyltransferase [Candidatus Dadabacteria bacterium]